MIRLAKQDDLEAVLRLQRLGYESMDSCLMGVDINEEHFNDLYTAAIKDDSFLVAVAEEDGAVVGVIVAHMQPLYVNHAYRSVYILAVYVDPKHRNKLLGCNLVNQAIAWGRANKATSVSGSVRLNDPGVRKIYERKGFKATEEVMTLKLPLEGNE